MRNNTPPSSPFFERDDMIPDDDDGEDDELIYVGDGNYFLFKKTHIIFVPRVCFYTCRQQQQEKCLEIINLKIYL